MFRELNSVVDELHSLMDRACPTTPTFKVHRSDDGKAYEMYLQGVDAVTAEVEVDDDAIVVKATASDGRCKVARTLQLPHQVADVSKILAEGGDSVLKVVIPDNALFVQPKPIRKKIEVIKAAKSSVQTQAGDASGNPSWSAKAVQTKAEDQVEFEVSDVEDVPSSEGHLKYDSSVDSQTPSRGMAHADARTTAHVANGYEEPQEEPEP